MGNSVRVRCPGSASVPPTWKLIVFEATGDPSAVVVSFAVRVTVPPAYPAASGTTSDVSASSFKIVPLPWPSTIVAPVGALRFTKKVSFGSKSTSPLMDTTMFLDVWPVEIMREPLVDV